MANRSLAIVKTTKIPKDYLKKYLTVEKNTLVASQEDLALARDTWPENFDVLFEIAAHAYNLLFTNHEGSYKMFKLDAELLDTAIWKEHFIMTRCILNLESRLYEAMCHFWDDRDGTCEARTKLFCTNMQAFGGKFKALVPNSTIDMYIHLLDYWLKVHIDMVVFHRQNGPLSVEQTRRLKDIWTKIFNIIKIHFQYGFENQIYTLRADELYFMQNGVERSEGPVERKPSFIGRMSKLLADAGHFGRFNVFASNSTAIQEPTPPPVAPKPIASTSKEKRSRSQDVGRSWHLDRHHSEPINIADVSLKISSHPLRSSPIKINL